jgi:hypothetical protein
MTAYSTRFRQSAQKAQAGQTKQTVNQNITTSDAQVNQARAEEDQRRAQGKPPARKP